MVAAIKVVTSVWFQVPDVAAEEVVAESKIAD